MDVARQVRKCSAPLAAGHNPWKSIPPPVNTTSSRLAETAAADVTPAMDLTSDRGNNKDSEDLSPSPNRTRRTKNCIGSSHPPHAFTGRLTNHDASAFGSEPCAPPIAPFIDFEKLYSFIQATRPAPAQLSKLLSDDSVDFLSEEHVTMLSRFFHVAISEPSADFPGIPADFARRFWDLMTAHYNRRKYPSRRPKLSLLTFYTLWFDALTVVPRIALAVFEAS